MMRGYSSVIHPTTLGSVDRRDIIYTVTRPRTPSTDQSSRRPSYHTTSTRRVNCLIDHCPGTDSTFTTGFCVFTNHRKALAERHLVSRRPLRVLPMTLTHQSLRLEGGCDDNRVRVWRPRGERLNPAFALQRHTTPTAGVMVWGVIAYDT
ncbi:uncharacterized protein TNCV_2913191 [Trichonephila clavipes]|nr:uncharacterized protein TNCV_2913191 [Trichonephila clavipes]